MNNQHYPMSTTEKLRLKPDDGRINRINICGARTRAGTPCRRYDLYANGRCPLHGGMSKSGLEHGRYKHGCRTKEMIAELRELRELIRESKGMIGVI